MVDHAKLDRMMIKNTSKSSIMNKGDYKHIMADDKHKNLKENVLFDFYEACLPSGKDKKAKKQIEAYLKFEDTDFENQVIIFISKTIKDKRNYIQAQFAGISSSEIETEDKQISATEPIKSLLTGSEWSSFEWSDSSRFVPQFSSSSTFSPMK